MSNTHFENVNIFFKFKSDRIIAIKKKIYFVHGLATSPRQGQLSFEVVQG